MHMATDANPTAFGSPLLSSKDRPGFGMTALRLRASSAKLGHFTHPSGDSDVPGGTNSRESAS